MPGCLGLIILVFTFVHVCLCVVDFGFSFDFGDFGDSFCGNLVLCVDLWLICLFVWSVLRFWFVFSYVAFNCWLW